MNYINILILACVLSLSAYAQDEYVDKSDNQISDFNLRIKSVTNDSLIYKAFGKTEKIALKDIYAYRYRNGYWIYPDTTIKGKVTGGSFVNGEFKTGDFVPDIPEYKKPENILKPYYYSSSTKFIDFRQDYKIEFTKDSLKTKTLKKNRELRFSLAADTLNALFICDIYKIIQDTLVISGTYGNKGVKYWKIPIVSVSYIDFQTDGQVALRITSSIIFSTMISTTMAGATDLIVIPGIQLKNQYDLNAAVNYKFVKVGDN